METYNDSNSHVKLQRGWNPRSSHYPAGDCANIVSFWVGFFECIRELGSRQLDQVQRACADIPLISANGVHRKGQN